MPVSHLCDKSLDELVSKLCSVLSEEKLNTVARETGFLTRQRKVTVKDFVRMLLFDHLQYASPSLHQHCLSLYSDSGKPVSKQAIDKKFNEGALNFIRALFELFLSHQMGKAHIPSDLMKHFTSIRVMDSTEFKLPDFFAAEFPGYGTSSAMACAAIQLEYDVLSRQIKYCSINSARESDKAVADERMNSISKGELILRDLGYYSTDSYCKIEQREAFYVSRLKRQVAIYYKRGNELIPLSWTGIIKEIEQTNECFDKWVYIGAEQKHPVRLMAWKLSKEDQKKRLQKKRDKKSKVSKQDILWSKLNVFITNIDDAILTPTQAYHLYKIRWQIELMFKTWKSILNITAVRRMKAVRFRCYLYSKLIWILICWDITGIAESIKWKSHKKLISPYKSVAVLKVKSTGLKKLIFGNRERIRWWLAQMIELLLVYGIKEDRINKIKLSELLRLK